MTASGAASNGATAGRVAVALVVVAGLFLLVAGAVFLLLHDRGDIPGAVAGVDSGSRVPDESADSRAARPTVAGGLPSAGIRLERPGPAPVSGIAGRVLDENGDGIEGATIAAEEKSGRAADPWGRIPVAETRSDDAGAFLMPEVGPGDYRLVCDAPGFGFQTATIRVDEGVVASADLVLAPRPDLMCSIVDMGDKPVAGAEVLVLAGADSSQVCLRRESDASGRVSFSSGIDSRFSSVTVMARKAGLGSGSAPLSGPAKVMLRPSVTLRPSRTLVCRFVPVDGSRLPSGLRFKVWAGKFQWEAAADGSGRATSEEFPMANDGLSITMLDRGWLLSPESATQRDWRHFEIPRKGDVDLEVPVSYEDLPAPVVAAPPPPPDPTRPDPDRATVVGRVVDPAGQPLAGIRVDFERVLDFEGVVTDALGRFRLSRATPPPTCRVGACRGRRPPVWTKPLELRVGEIVGGITITLEPQPDLIVRVVGTDGRGQAGVAVSVEEEDGFPGPTCRTGTDGSAEISGIRSATVTLKVASASLPRGVLVDGDFRGVASPASFEGVPIVIRLVPDVVCSGTVTLEDGSVLAHAVIRFEPVAVEQGPAGSAFGGPSIRSTLRRPVAGPRYARTNERGEFKFRPRSGYDYEPTELRRVGPFDDGKLVSETFDVVNPIRVTATFANPIVARKR